MYRDNVKTFKYTMEHVVMAIPGFQLEYIWNEL